MVLVEEITHTICLVVCYLLSWAKNLSKEKFDSSQYLRIMQQIDHKV